MSGLALALVMCGAALHVAWSIAAKFGSRGRDPVGFIWASSLITSMLLAPIALWTASATQVSWSSVLFGASIAATLQLSYFLLVQTGYAVGDVSVLYPISRGIGPALTMVGAVLIFGERPNLLALVGGGIIVFGVVMIGIVGGRGSTVSPAILIIGVVTGVLIASYTLWDTFAMRALESPPLVHVWIVAVLQCLALTPWMRFRKRSAFAPFRETRVPLLVAAVTTTLSYLAVVTALTLAPAALVAPLREMSVVFVTLAGWLVFKEPNPVPRAIGAVIVVIGGLFVALG